MAIVLPIGYYVATLSFTVVGGLVGGLIGYNIGSSDNI